MGDIEKFHLQFYESISIVENTRGLNNHVSLLLGLELSSYVLRYLFAGSLENNSGVQLKYKSGDLSDKRKQILFYSSEYVFLGFFTGWDFPKW